MYKKEEHSYYSHKRFPEYNSFFYITTFFRTAFIYVKRDGILNFIKKNKEGMEFEEINLDINDTSNIIFLSESWHDYKDKTTTPEIEELLEEGNFIKLCEIGFLDHITMTKDNFINILFSWDKIIDQQPPFALLCQDDKDWFDVKPFDTQEAMEQFVADHTQK